MAGIPEYPNVEIRTNARARNFILRSAAGGYCLTVPPGATRTKIIEVLDKLLPQLEKKIAQKNSATGFHPGQIIEFHGHTITIINSAVTFGRIISRQTSPTNFEITVSQNLQFDQPDITKKLIEHILNILQFVARRRLPEIADKTSAALGIKPKGWNITKARNRNGSCTSRGSINLSCTLMLMPIELIQHVVCHELAHLTHFDHSPKFHKLCDDYCQTLTGLSEKELIKRSKLFRSPLPR